ncbi:hypothetical protein G5I_05282 [Acromyrmex echinatior]|uniref:Uncharacterized protein n=1 Tax=Acromyrmex echinatior TaxID=103372 RepID=F4WI13_ACREC|nr:hypothetical protein G5I_05282 [Acromyrmex echinatior]
MERRSNKRDLRHVFCSSSSVASVRKRIVNRASDTSGRKSEPVERGRTVCSDARRYVLLHVSFTYKEERQADGKKEEDEDRVPERTRHEPRLLGFSGSPSFF